MSTSGATTSFRNQVSICCAGERTTGSRDSLTLTLGYAHNWVAPAHEDWATWTNENRIYQQFQYATSLGRVRLLHRLRNEQRWQEEVVDDVLTGRIRFSDRVRYLASLTIPFSERPSVPALVLSDEILLQFGHDIVANTFDQNRLFAGIKKSLSPSWSFDLGYMLVYQQKASGYQYDLNHTLRFFFYFTPDFTPDRRGKAPAHDPRATRSERNDLPRETTRVQVDGKGTTNAEATARISSFSYDFPEIDERGQELLRWHDHPHPDGSW